MMGNDGKSRTGSLSLETLPDVQMCPETPQVKILHIKSFFILVPYVHVQALVLRATLVNKNRKH